MGFDIEKIQTEFAKGKASLEAKNKALFDAMKKCTNCQETETKFIPCKAHMDALKALDDEMQTMNMQSQLKMVMHPDEMKKIMEERTKLMQEMMAKQFSKQSKGKSRTPNPCQACGNQ